MSSSGSAPVPGWYPDPIGTGQLRYWDGEAWTDAVNPLPGDQPPAGQPPGGMESVRPPFVGAPPAGSYGGPGPGGSDLGDIGPWVSDMFSNLLKRGVELAVLLFLVPWAGFLITLLAARAAVADVSIDTVNNSVDGFEAARLIPAALILPVAILLIFVCQLAAYDLLDAAHRGIPRSPGESLAAGLRGLPRAIWWGFVLGLAFLAVFAIVFGIPAALAFAVDPAFFLLYFLFVLAMFPLFIWLWVKLAFFVPAVVVSPRGTNPITASWDLSRGRFWPIIGRLILLMLMVYGVAIMGQIVVQVLLTVVLELSFEFDSVTGEPLIDDRPISSYDVIEFDRIIPGAPLLALLTAIYLMTNAASQAVSASGLAALYVRAGGPSRNALDG